MSSSGVEFVPVVNQKPQHYISTRYADFFILESYKLCTAVETRATMEVALFG